MPFFGLEIGNGGKGPSSSGRQIPSGGRMFFLGLALGSRGKVRRHRDVRVARQGFGRSPWGCTALHLEDAPRQVYCENAQPRTRKPEHTPAIKIARTRVE